MKDSISISKAFPLSLRDLNQLVFTKYHFGLSLFRLYRNKKYKNYRLRINEYPDRDKLNRFIKEILSAGIVKQLSSVPQCYVFIGVGNLRTEEIICSADPFAFISHLSAMAYHGLTYRMPTTMFISSPPQKKWKEFAVKRMKKNLGENFEIYIKNNLPPLQKIPFNKIGKQKINCYSSIHSGAFKIIKDENIRVSTIGRTFLEMLQRPDLCGGIYHVIETFEEQAEQYLNLIINEIQVHGKPIDKIRAGYILEDRCRLKHENINEWLKFVSRGGSRKLDPAQDYSSEYSERWCLSLNI